MLHSQFSGVIVASTAQTRSLFSQDKERLIKELLSKAPSDIHPDGNSIGQIDVRVDYKPIYLDIVSKNMFDRISHCIQLK